MMKSKDIRWIALGDYIEPCEERNISRHNYPMLGINKDKEFMPTVANVSAVDISKYKIVKNGLFVFSGMQTGRDVCIRIALYENDQPALISPAYTTFTVKEEGLIPEYLFMYFNREEMDRFGWFISDSSVRSNLDWNRFVEIQIPLPSIDKQRKLVAAWKGLRDMKKENERIAEPLESLCRSYLQDLKYNYPLTAIGAYIEPCDERNSNLEYKVESVKGLSTSKQIIDTKANLEGVSLSSYKVLKPNEFAFVADTSRRGDKMSFGFNQTNEVYLVSSISTVFKVKDETLLLSGYLYLWICRSEFDRYARFNSWGSAREVFSYDEMTRVEIPIPPIDIQKAIVEIYHCADESRKIAAEANKLSSTICPALMQKVING